MKYWYVYKILFKDYTYYIGYRGSKVTPENDLGIKYFSSSKLVKNKILTEKPTYIIIDVFEKQNDAYQYEQQLIFDKIDDIFILNKFSYLNRKGFGILTKQAKDILSEKSKQRWEDANYKSEMSKKQSKSLTEDRKRNILNL